MTWNSSSWRQDAPYHCWAALSHVFGAGMRNDFVSDLTNLCWEGHCELLLCNRLGRGLGWQPAAWHALSLAETPGMQFQQVSGPGAHCLQASCGTMESRQKHLQAPMFVYMWGNTHARKPNAMRSMSQMAI